MSTLFVVDYLRGRDCCMKNTCPEQGNCWLHCAHFDVLKVTQTLQNVDF